MSLRINILICLLAPMIIGQTRPIDVDGWEKIKWGMSTKEVRAVYNVQQTILTAQWDHLILEPINIADLAFQSTVSSSHTSDQIVSLEMFRNYGVATDPSKDFQTLAAILLNKYGPPNSQNRKQKVWTFPSTSIVLVMLEIQGRRCTISLSYKATIKRVFALSVGH